jgi:hypothetical protein
MNEYLLFSSELDNGNFDADSNSRGKKRLGVLKFSYNKALNKIFNPNSSSMLFFSQVTVAVRILHSFHNSASC